MEKEIIKRHYYYLADRSNPNASQGELNRIIRITDISSRANPRVVWGDILDIRTKRVSKNVREYAYLVREEITKEDIEAVKKALGIIDLRDF